MSMICRLLCVLGFLALAQANVIGIDFGSDAFKVAIVQPGSPLDVVTNFQSKRKTPMSISFYRNERQFGADSIALQTRKPELTFSKIYRMLGRHLDHPHVQQLLKEHHFHHNIAMNETTGFMTLTEGELMYTPEELVAMMMQHAKDMTESFGGKLIKDCVVTVPSFFTQHERRALYAAADIADLKILSLIEENTAAALHYGMDRVFETPNTVLYYNMGAGSVQVSVVTYSSMVVKEAGKNKTIGQFEVVGKAWDSSLGGFNVDVTLADMMADRFNEAWNKKASGKGKNIRDFVRPMARLRSEATKIKEILSANSEYPIRIEQLHADTDLVTKITRTQLEEACQPLFQRLTLPIQQALDAANITISDVHSVELLGGGVRIPYVKKTLDDYFKTATATAAGAAAATPLEVGQHLNGDEAMALGAAFRAANLSTAFRVRKVGMSDYAPFGVSVHLETLPVQPSATAEKSTSFFSNLFGTSSTEKKTEAVPVTVEEASDEKKPVEWSKQTELYSAKSVVSGKVKTVSFAYDKDILCRLEYTDPSSLPAGTTPILGEFSITGISAFTEEHKDKNATAPKVSLSFVLDGDGVYNLLRAEVTAELPKPVEVIEEAIVLQPDADADASNNATDASADATNATAADESSATANTTSTTTNNKTSTDGKKKNSKKDKKKDTKEKPHSTGIHHKDTTLRSPLVVTEVHQRVTPASWSFSAIAESRSRLRALDAADAARKAREAALNDLEAYCYKVKNTIADEEEQLKAVSTEEQRQEVLELANAAEEWIYDEGREAAVSVYKNKQAELRKKADAIFNRFDELTARPAAIAKATSMLTTIKSTIADWSLTKPHITEKEIDGLLEVITKMEDWMEAKQTEQASRSTLLDAVFHSTDVPVQMKAVKTAFDKLSKKPKPAPEKTTTTSSNNNSTNNNNTINVNTTNADTNSSGSTDNNNSTEADKNDKMEADEL